MKFVNLASFGSKTRLNFLTQEHINVIGSCCFKTCSNSLTVFQVAIIRDYSVLSLTFDIRVERDICLT